MTEITQADRDAAAVFYPHFSGPNHTVTHSTSLVRAFAAHREAALAEGKLLGAKAMQEVIDDMYYILEHIGNEEPDDSVRMVRQLRASNACNRVLTALDPAQIAKEAG